MGEEEPTTLKRALESSSSSSSIMSIQFLSSGNRMLPLLTKVEIRSVVKPCKEEYEKQNN